MRVLLVGSNPSTRASGSDAFTEDTKSGKILREWLEGIDAEFIFDNISTKKTEGNRPLTRSEMAEAREELAKRIKTTAPDRIVALGKSAAECLSKIGLTFLEMPHPSGLNRKLNDKQYVADKLQELKAHCSPPEK